MAARPMLATAVAAGALLVMTACSGGSSGETAASDPTATPEAVSAVDYANTDWVFRPGGNVAETRQVSIVDGAGEIDGIAYVVGDPVIADVDGDGVDDAAVMIEATEGNGVDRQWYLWITTDDGAVQSTLPIARESRCGTTVHSVGAVDGGIEIVETRRLPDESSLSCDQDGSDDRTRTVTAAPVGPQDTWWPVQTAPIGGFGGLCPTAQELEGFAHDDPLYAAPNIESLEVTEGEQVYITAVEPWPVYGEDMPGFVLVAVKKGDELGCAWAEAG